ncbi:hypothetical protein D047_3186B, partial [Vibrio parahaemolyticus VPTS-2010_2]
IR